VVRRVLAIFESEVLRMRNAHTRSADEFAGPREVSAREAFELALPLARAWAADAALIGINTGSLLAPCLSSLSTSMPGLSAEGRLAPAGLWRIRFHSRDKQENLYVEVPWRGPLSETRSEAPHGHEWPSDTDQILSDGWLDSGDALAMAIAKARDVTQRMEWPEPPQMQLSSRANVLAGKVLEGPMRDGMFTMEQAWHVFLTHKGNEAGATATVTVPAHGGDAIIVDVRYAQGLQSM
jgi:hypothetical protein